MGIILSHHQDPLGPIIQSVFNTVSTHLFGKHLVRFTLCCDVADWCMWLWWCWRCHVSRRTSRGEYLVGWDEEPPRCGIVDLRIPPRKGKVYFFEVNLDFGLSKNIRKCCKLMLKSWKTSGPRPSDKLRTRGSRFRSCISLTWRAARGRRPQVKSSDMGC